jgi:hypothetical protein
MTAAAAFAVMGTLVALALPKRQMGRESVSSFIRLIAGAQPGRVKEGYTVGVQISRDWSTAG